MLVLMTTLRNSFHVKSVSTATNWTMLWSNMGRKPPYNMLLKNTHNTENTSEFLKKLL